ncbi:hypothetical protein M7775_13230 [Sporomusa sphaeroides DSM 2875]|uniref:hypothetical protein n=1 Tax=Sporomusa sphaeroides TaxID=47679 RepID=UPI00202FCC8C|nr:hypothetical protein [Sporomusa sphaeroides]MCM0759514.1 hypothetical protein [Sporomusa sphaeroides DSM 2875]
MWDSLVRWLRVEVALFICYLYAVRRGDRHSYRYCADRSILVSVFCVVALVAGLMLVGAVAQFLQQGCR